MHKKQKVLYSLLLVIAILVTMILPAAAAQVSDIQGHWAKDQISRWLDMGLVNGYKDGSFKPNNYITRAEFMTVANKAFGFTKMASENYPDAKKSDWFYSEALKAKAAGYMDVYADGSVKAKNYITREEAAVALARILKLKPADSSKANFKDAGSINSGNRGYINSVVEKGYIAGYKDNTFKPLNKTTRAEAVTLLSKVVGQLYNKAGKYGPSKGTTTIEGNVTINKAGVKLSNTIIKGNLYLTEGIGDGEATLDNVTVKGTTTISGGGEHSIVALNSALGSVYIKVPDNTKVRLVAQGTTSIKSVVAESATKLEESNLTGTGFNEVTISVPENASVDLAGNFEEVDITAANAKVSLLSGSAKEVTIQESYAASQLEIGENAAVTTLVANSAVSVTGKGKIETAQINTGNVSIEQKPTTVKVAEGVTGVTVANSPAVSPAPSQPITGSNPGGGGGSGGGGGNSGGNGGNGGNQTQTVATPTVSSPAGSVASGTSVTLSTATPGASIYYTLDGTTPTIASTLYTTAVVLSNTGTSSLVKTIKAIAVKSGMYNSAEVSITYTITPAEKVAAPTATPNGGAVEVGRTVELTSITSGAKIYYTTDGSQPTAASTPYTAPIAITKAMTITAVAVKAGLADSEVATFSYTILSSDKVAAPTATPNGGAIASGTTVSLNSATSGAKIYYTTDGSIPTAASTLYTAPIAITKATTIMAVAVKAGLADSEVATFSYTILSSDKVAAPTATPNGGAIASGTTVSLNSATSGAKIYYTTDESIPTSASTLYTGSVVLTNTGMFPTDKTIKAIAVKAGMVDSTVSTFTYSVFPREKVLTPKASPAGGEVDQGTGVVLSTSTSGARIYYTTDNSNPTIESTFYSAPVVINKATTIKVIAVKEECTDSEVATFNYTILLANKVAAPTASLGTIIPVSPGTTVELETSTVGATIYYTIDGSIPTTSSTKYVDPIILTNTSTEFITKTIRAIAVKDGMENSSEAVFAYTVLSQGTVQAPTASPDPNNPDYSYVSSGTKVSLMTTTTGAEIYYTLDGTDPTSASTKYTGAIELTNYTVSLYIPKTIKAIAVKAGMNDSPVRSFTYNVFSAPKVGNPRALPATSEVAPGTTVSLTTETSGAKIYYTTDGTVPTIESTLYIGSITINQATIIKAIAVKQGYSNSDDVTFNYTILPANKVYAPTTTQNSQAVSSGTAVPLSTLTDGATIYYTIDNTIPTTESTVYTGPVILTNPSTSMATKTIKAIAVKDGMETSSVSTFSYLVFSQSTVDAPKASKPSGQVAVGTTVTLSSSTGGAKIYYTTDGSKPTTASTQYSGPIVINAATTIKAIAVKDYMNDSSEVEFSYTVPELFTGAETSEDGEKIYITFDKEMADPLGNEENFSVSTGAAITVKSVSLKLGSPEVIELVLEEKVAYGDDITVSYVPGTIQSSDGQALEAFTKTVINKVLVPAEAPKVEGAETSDGEKIYITFDKEMADPSDNEENFSVSTGAAITVKSVSLKLGSPEVIELVLEEKVAYGDDITVSYVPGTIQSSDGQALEAFTEMVINRVPVPVEPLKIQGIETSDDGKKIFVKFNKEMADPDGNKDKFTVTTGAAITITTVSAITLNLEDPKVIELELQEAVAYGDEIRISYQLGDIQTSDGKELLEYFENKTVINKVFN